MFINRERELNFLENKWEESQAQMIVLWGKRRVGKTELVKRFIRNRPHVYFLAESTNEREQLKRFSSSLGEFFKEPLLFTRGFENWEESFRYITEKNKNTNTLFCNYLVNFILQGFNIKKSTNVRTKDMPKGIYMYFSPLCMYISPGMITGLPLFL